MTENASYCLSASVTYDLKVDDQSEKVGDQLWEKGRLDDVSDGVDDQGERRG